MFHKILTYKYLLNNKRFITAAVIVFVVLNIVVFEIKRRYAIDIIKGINFPFDDLYFYLKSKVGLSLLINYFH